MEAKPTIRIKLEGKGGSGASLENLAHVAANAAKFLKMLAVDLGEPSDQWIAEDFVNASIGWGVRNPRHQSLSLWERGLHESASPAVVDDEINLRIRRETRLQFYRIGLDADNLEKVTIGISRDGDANNLIFYPVVRDSVVDFDPEVPDVFRYHGEVQGKVHAFYKESKRPKLVIRELSTSQLIHCYFSPDMYEHAVETLKERDAVVFVEGEVSEDSEKGVVTDIEVTDFTLAPEFDEIEMESMIGSFHGIFAPPEEDWLAPCNP
jgi:hypothetical protein